MNQNKRDTLKITVLASNKSLLRWFTPSIAIVSVPSHAQTSQCDGQSFALEISFTTVFACAIPSFCEGRSDQEIIDSESTPGPMETFCISSDEQATGIFNRNIDFDGSGPAADFIFVRYTIVSIDATQASGTVTTSNVDTGVSLGGEWTARLVG